MRVCVVLCSCAYLYYFGRINFIRACISYDNVFNVEEELQFVIHPQDQERIEGENVELQCSTSFARMVIFTWEFAPTDSDTPAVINTTSTDRYSIATHQWSTRLSLRNVKHSDAGTYNCKASAQGKTIATRALLDVVCEDCIKLIRQM